MSIERSEVGAEPGGRLAESLAGDLMFLATRFEVAGIAHANRALARVDLKVRSYSVLTVAASGARPSQRELADFLLLDPSQIVALVDDLESAELVRREPDVRDRRSKVTAATDAGRRLARRAARLVQQAEAKSLDNLTAEERDDLRRLLLKTAFAPARD